MIDEEINGKRFAIFGEPLENAVSQMRRCMRHDAVTAAALMADHHKGYAVPIGGVIAYDGCISPSGVGFDIACGNKAVLTDAHGSHIRPYIGKIMDEVVKHISFGIGRHNKERIDHDLFDDPAWEIPAVKPLKEKAQEQLGTVGSGNHYVDIFADEFDRIWIGVHFGSRGLGHAIATHYIKAGGGVDGMDVDPVVLDASSELGQEYIAAMKLAGRYAYAGRDWVCSKVAEILDGSIIEEVHNHHNFAWEEMHNGKLNWVIRKGATPAWAGQEGFIGGTMGEQSVIIEGNLHPDCVPALFSTVHGAGRVMSRTEAAGKYKGWGKNRIKVSEGKVSKEMMEEWIRKAGVTLRGGGLDESPHAYKRLKEVLEAQGDTVEITTTLTPLGVAMAGENEIDPYKD